MSIPIGSATSGSDQETMSQSAHPSENIEPKLAAPVACDLMANFCEKIAPQATRYAMSIVRRLTDAEEIVQESFCRLVQSKELVRGELIPEPAGAKAFLFATVRNLSIDWLRQQGRRRFDPVDVGQLPSGSLPTSAERLGQLEQGVQSAIEGLPKPWADALQLKVNGGLSYDEIAKVMDASHGQVRTWIYRARKQLQQELFQNGLMGGELES